MENVHFVSASAGSGKTYTLTDKMVEMVNGGYKPENFILTTFTKAAAAEFKEKIRVKFYEKGVDAAGLDNATVGTIHSVAQQFLTKYWYLLGISPEMSVITDDDKAFYMNQTLKQCVDKDTLRFFNGLVDKFKITREEGGITISDYDYWKRDLEKLISSMVNYNVSDFDSQVEKSKELLAEICRMAKEEGRRMYYEMPKKDDVKYSVQCVYDSVDSTDGRVNKEAKKAILRRLLSDLESWDGVSPFVLKEVTDVMLDTKKVNIPSLRKLCEGQFVPFEDFKANFFRVKQVYEIFEKYIDNIFSIAKEWNERYDAYKKENRMLDFSDLEKLFMQLLDNDEVVGSIKEKYKVVMVDEFQDCSPLQVAIFRKLAALVEHNIWVGDLKQAIYGFRGTDVGLIEDVLASIKNKSILDTSWRSAPSLVEFANNVFSYAFKVHNKMPEETVKLKVADKNKDMDGKLANWHFVVERADDRFNALVSRLRKFKEDENLQWKDIAVLACYNDGVRKIADKLKAAGIPVNALSDKDSEKSPMDAVVQAIFSIAADKDNELSKAIVMQYLGGESIAEIMKRVYTSESCIMPLTDLITRKAEELGMQPLSDFVESMFVELGIGDMLQVGGLGNSREVYNALQWYENKAIAYEERCSVMGLACSLTGFVESLKASGGSNPSDDDGVTVATYHKSKGLEWRAVILWDLNKDYMQDDSKYIAGVNLIRDGNYCAIRLVPGFLFNVADDSYKENGTYRQLHNASLKEGVRLLYVGVTRAKQFLITITAEKDRKKKYGLEWFAAVMNSTVLADQLKIPVEECTLVDPEQVTETPDTVQVLAKTGQSEAYEPLYLQPSKMQFYGKVEVCQPIKFGDRVQVKGEDSSIGDCIHHFMQLYGNDLERNRQLLERLAVSYGVSVDC
ncbi:MAG: UvrD-helicase domain-containing protein, partial [Bacteroidales bacterium]|nr:UvrD-helicase domain-containing protein [Bacteroidales bacterium]